MKQLHLFFLICVALSSLLFASNSETSKRPVYPLNINYNKEKIPDSINDFIKVYFRIKGCDVLKDYTDVINIWGQKVKEKMQQLIDTKQLDSKTAKDPKTFALPVANFLQIRIFRDSINYPQGYKIDSILWKNQLIFPIDTNGRFEVFTPTDKNDSLPYKTLREFIELVINSKVLK